MPFKERKHNRIESFKLISYTCIDENNNVVSQGMGRTLNVSEGGILLETHVLVAVGTIVSLAIGLEDDLVNLSGKVMHNKPGKKGMFEAGIEFQPIPDQKTVRVLNKYIQAFKSQMKGDDSDQ